MKQVNEVIEVLKALGYEPKHNEEKRDIYFTSFGFEAFPERLNCVWAPTFYEYENRVYDYVELPKGSIKKLIGRELSWNDEPVELQEE